MQTRCPHCNTQFRVSSDHLALAHGAVRCGRCFETFNAEDQLIQAQQASRQNSTTDKRTTSVSERSLDVLDEIETRDASIKKTGLSTLASTLAALLLLTLFFAQYLYFNRTALAQNLQIRPTLEQLCKIGGCSLPLIRAPKEIQLVDRDIRSHPSKSNALLVEVEMMNKAPFKQAYPKLTLTLHDITGKALSGRRFTPKEYLPPDADLTQGIDAKKDLKIIIELIDPGEEAVGFEFEFH